MRAILLSGGIDSIALAHWKRPEFAITLDYGQLPAATEIAAATEVARALAIQHEVLRVDCSTLGSGDLLGQPPLAAAPVPEWWPYRNQLLVTLAGMRAISRGVTELMVGSVASDSQHADGTSKFYEILDNLMRMQEGNLRVSAPAIELSTVELVRTSGVPREVLAWAHSCHVGPFACGACRGCIKHYNVMKELYACAY